MCPTKNGSTLRRTHERMSKEDRYFIFVKGVGKGSYSSPTPIRWKLESFLGRVRCLPSVKLSKVFLDLIVIGTFRKVIWLLPCTKSNLEGSDCKRLVISWT